MTLWTRVKEWLNPRPVRDPKVDRVLAISRQTQRRRARSHDSLMRALAEGYDEDYGRDLTERRSGHAD